MSRDETVTCARCGASGELGDHPGEGRIVAGGGETALGAWRNDLLCDDCADVLMLEVRPSEAGSDAGGSDG